MNKTINKDDYIANLKKSLRYFHGAKAIVNKERIKDFQGFSKGIVIVLWKLGAVSIDKLQVIVKDAKLYFSAIIYTNALN